jgi:hypothetical protein
MGSRVQRIVIGVADQNELREQCADCRPRLYMFVPEEGGAVPESFKSLKLDHCQFATAQ